MGLAQRSQNRPGQIYDRFRERIMFPSTDARGTWSGSARGRCARTSVRSTSTPPRASCTRSARCCSGSIARGRGPRQGSVILVEGYTDVLALHQAGLSNAVGIMGTALTDKQIEELERVAKVLVLCLDADRAGQDAMLRAAQLTDQRKLELRVVALPDGTDPAELIERAGADALRERVAASVPFVASTSIGSSSGRTRAAPRARDRAFRRAAARAQGPGARRVRRRAPAPRRRQARADPRRGWAR